MAKRRTKQDKVVARLRRELMEAKPSMTLEFPEKPTAHANFYQPEINLQMNLLFADLTRTAIVTILALVFQTMTYLYLNHGGWQVITKLVERG